MATIADLSDAPKYTIKTACAQTGIRAVTLRAWERRYGLLTPRRTEGNYRLYSERDVAVLRWLRGRVDGGMTISRAAAELNEVRRSGVWPEPLPPLAPRLALAAPTANPPADYAERLFTALTGHNEGGATDVLREANALFDVTTVCLEMLTPCLVKIGEGWLRGEIRISTEHFASTYLRGHLLALLQAYPARRNAPRIIVGCAAGERHEIGSLMFATLLRRDGYRVEFLGADVPTDDLLDYARDERPALICLSAGSEESVHELARVHDGLATMRPRPQFGFGGRIFNARLVLRPTVPGRFLGENAAEGGVIARKILGGGE